MDSKTYQHTKQQKYKTDVVDYLALKLWPTTITLELDLVPPSHYLYIQSLPPHEIDNHNKQYIPNKNQHNNHNFPRPFELNIHSTRPRVKFFLTIF